MRDHIGLTTSRPLRVRRTAWPLITRCDQRKPTSLKYRSAWRGLDPCRADCAARHGSRGLFEPAIHALPRFRLGRSRANVMEHPGAGAAHAVAEALGRIGMDGAVHISPFGVADGVVCGKGLADRQEGLLLIAPQMGREINGSVQHPARLGL